MRLIYLLLSFIPQILSYNILALFPMPSMSHVRLGIEITKELAARGHNITMITPYPQGIETPNFREISQAELNVQMQADKKLFFEWEDMSPFSQLVLCYQLGYHVTEYTYQNPQVQELLNSGATFDLVFMDQFYSEALMGIAYLFKAPVVLSSSLESASWTHHLLGNPEQWAFMPHAYLTTSNKMNFLQRVDNFLLHVTEEIYRRLIAYPHNNELLHKYVPDAPHLYDLMYNVSLIFVNSHHSISSPTARMPNLIPFAGVHAKSSVGNISKELKSQLDGYKDGIVYFAMGSNLISTTLPVEKREAFLRAFSKLKQKVLWKWETDELPGKPDNLILSKWWPQHDILSHPNTVAFISHGGLMSTIEATSWGVPILGVPIYADQKMNMKRVRDNGHAVIVEYDDITEEKISFALNELIYNKTFKENARRMSEIMNDRPMKPLDEVIYWIEFVIRHRGAPFLKSAALELNWFQQNSFDVIAFVMGLPLLIIWAVVKQLRRVLNGNKLNGNEKFKKS